jgi:hypothetical protein
MKKLLTSVAVAAILVSSAAFAQAPMDPAPAADNTTKAAASDTATPAKKTHKHKGAKKSHKKKKADASAPAAQ